MKPRPVHRLPPALELAAQRIKLAARDAAERTIESLGLAALAATHAFQRDGLLEAQFELNRKSAIFVLAFNEAFDQRVLKECGAGADDAAVTAGGSTAWDALSLVDDREVEAKVAADRFALEIAGGCEWELRELEAYVASLLGPGRGSGAATNPLRPEVIGEAVIRGIDRLSDRAEVRRVLVAEFARSLGSTLRGTYQAAIADLRGSGVQPASLAVRQAAARGPSGLGLDRAGADEATTGGRTSGFDAGGGASRRGGFGPSTRGGTTSGFGGMRSAPAAMGHVDPALMSLIRRIAFTDVGGSGWQDDGGGAAVAGLPNLIHAHRDELRQASTGALDHMVIDVVGSLFDQILSDPKVPPQMARQIARLQLPVLRAALGDPGFFSSRRHPVRRFVNRIASLGAAFDDFADEPGRAFLGKVRELVQQVVEGDFDQIELYERKLAALEQFVDEQGRREVDAQADHTAELLAAKEDELRLRALYAQQLQGELEHLDAPEFLREFVAQVWSQVLVQAAAREGADSERVRRLREVGRELFMSVQPKTSPAHRKSFLAELPRLMHDLKGGLDLIGWPEDRRKAFFGQLLPAHAESLKAQPLRPLDFNLLAKKVETALGKSLPSPAEVKTALSGSLPVLTDEIAAPAFSAEEAARIGLVDEAQVDWDGTVDIDLGAEPPPQPAEVAIPGLPAAADPAELLEPVEGRSLADHVQVGFAYQMNLEGQWQKVRLSHVSPGRTFFVFTHGKRHKQTISLTHRMLVRMCESGRLRAFESAYLLERATARARKQLSALRPA